MARITPLQQNFVAMYQDLPRYGIPKGRVWNMVDWIPSLGSSLRKRGGTQDASNSISAAASSATYVNSVVHAPFSAGAKLCALTDNSKLVTIASDKTITLVSASAVTCVQRPSFHADRLIIPVSDGTTAPKTYDGSTFGALAGSPPAGKYSATWKNYTVLGGANATRRRTYFSAHSDPTLTWDTTQGWWDVGHDITGYAALPNVLLIFGQYVTARFRGSVAPPGGDIARDDPVFNVGCTDARSIDVDGPIACFANPSGVYLTNGTVQVTDLTDKAGLKRHWLANLASYSTSTWTIAGGFYRHLYYVTVMNGSTFVDSYVFDPQAQTGWRNANFKHIMYAPSIGIAEELYAASRSRAYVEKISSIYDPATSATDADGTAVTPVLETPFYDDLKGAAQRVKDAFVRYDLRDTGATNPTWAISYIVEPDDAYTAASTTLAETSDDTRSQIPIRKVGRGLGLRIAQSNAASDAKLVSIEAHLRPREMSR